MHFDTRRLAQFDIAETFSGKIPAVLAQVLFGFFCAASVMLIRLPIGLAGANAGPFALIYPAVIISTLFGSWRAGLVSYASLFLCVWYFLLPPAASFELAIPTDGPRLIVNLSTVLVILIFAEIFRSAVRNSAKQRDAALAALQDRETQMRMALEAGRLGSLTWDVASGDITTSAACRTIFGHDPKAPFTYRQLKDAIHPDDRDRVAKAVDHSIVTHSAYETEHRILTPAGELRWLQIRAEPVSGTANALCLTGIVLDVTERKRADARREALIYLTDTFRETEDATEIEFAAAQILGETLDVSRVGYGTIDHEAETLRVERDWNMPGVDTLAGVLALRDYGSFIESLKRGEFISISDVRLDSRTAEAAEALENRSARAFVNVPVLEHDRLVAVLYINHASAREWSKEDLSLIREIAERTRSASERIRSAATLRESEARFRALAQAMPNQVWSARADGQLDWFNDKTVEYAGLAHDRLLGNGWAVMVHPDDLSRVAEKWSHSLASGERYETEFRLRRHDGAYRWHLVRALPIDGERGVARWIGTNTDIDDQKFTQSELVRLNALLEERVEERTRDLDRIWRLSTDLMLVARFDGTVVAINPAASSMLGWSEGELIGTSFLDLVHADDRAVTIAEADKLSKGKVTLNFENRYRHRDGSYRWISWTAVPDAQLMHGVGRDVTSERAAALALREAEDRLRQSQKMEAIGQLTGGIAHDFNNLLTGIIGSLDMLRQRMPRSELDQTQRFMDVATNAAQRAAALTHRLLAFARRQSLDAKAVDVNVLVTSMEELLRRTLGESVDLQVRLSDGAWSAQTDENQLESALLNLAINARDAMPHGGKLTIETENIAVADDYTNRQDGLQSGEYVIVSVSDTGQGMPPDVLAQACEPFFTTKPIGQGTGLGLSMIYGFAKQSGGHLRIYSEVGHGTTVKLYLPRYADRRSTDVQVTPTIAMPRGAGEAVLVVEDDAAVRFLVVEVLHELGYMALEAADGQQAIPILESATKIDLMISDVGLPGMNGRQLAEITRQRRPELAILFMTGYAEGAAIRSDFLAPGMQMISKPFAMEAFALKVREIVKGTQA